MRKTAFKDEQGILLVEVLAGVVIISVSLTLIIHSLMASLRASTFSADYTRALLVLDNIFFDLSAEAQTASSFSQKTACDKPFEKFECQVEQKSTFAAAGGDFAGLKDTTATVLWQAGRNQKRLSATTLAFEKE